MVDRVRMYLARLDRLMPNDDRLAQMKRYSRETMAMLAQPVAA